LVIALAVFSADALAAQADSDIALLCGLAHVNEAASAYDILAYPAGYYVASLKEQVGLGDPRIILTTNEEFYLCTRPAVASGSDSTGATLPMRQRTVKFLFVPAIRFATGGPG
jgi:hypothetical protein